MTDAIAAAGPGARPRPIVLVVLDGFGIGHDPAADAVVAAPMPVWRGLLERWPHAALRASEDAVGLPAGQMGNSEVGHLNLGAGRPDRDGRRPLLRDGPRQPLGADGPWLRGDRGRSRGAGTECHSGHPGGLRPR